MGSLSLVVAEMVGLVSVSLRNLAVPLHGVVDLEIADNGERCAVVVGATGTGVRCTVPADVACGVTHYQPFGESGRTALWSLLDAGWEEGEETAVEV